MRLVLWKTKVLTEVLQGTNLNIVDAFNTVKATIESLEAMRSDEEGIRNQIQASVVVLAAKGVDVEAEFSRLHRQRRQPCRQDENPESTAELSLPSFYDKEFKAVLDTLIQQYKENLAKCLEKVKSLSVVLQPPLRSNHKSSDVKELLSLFPKQAPDVDAFTAEFEIFVWTMNEKNAIKGCVTCFH
jgi:hypothetical protein